MQNKRIAIDIGGTFTDLVLFNEEDQTYQIHKVLTTPENQAKGVMRGMTELIDRFEEISYFVHGTTAGLNAFLEKKGARVALLATAGFRDIYEIARANRPDMYSIQYRKPTPLVNRQDVYEVPERILADGTVEKQLELSIIQQLAEEIVRKGYQSVVVCLLHAYKNPVHEQLIQSVFQDVAPHVSLSLSHDVAREWREYERTSTTVINGYIAPIVEKYLTTLENETSSRGLLGDVFIMQSNGGVMTSKLAKHHPIQTLLSGPVGGTIGGINLSKTTGSDNLICVDMGGTSFDVSMVIDGKPDVTSETHLEGFPIMTPMVNIHTIGAGGGSVAWIEAGGLRVGPKSAGAYPGPACYGRGGVEPTVTDANLVLNRIDSEGFLGGKMKLHEGAAYQAVANLAEQLGLEPTQTAEGICDIANAKMTDAIRTLTVRKGIDPRDFTLVAFGGAGPMHAVFIADLLDMKRVLVPSTAGVFSAWGMLQTDLRHDAVRTFYHGVTEVGKEELEPVYQELELEITDVLAYQNIAKANMTFYRTADLRYVGQEYTVNVPGDCSLPELINRFHEMHLNIYGHNNPNGMVEFVSLRVIGYGALNQREDAPTEKDATTTSTPVVHPNPRVVKSIIFGGVETTAAVFTRAVLEPGQRLQGPVIIEDGEATTVVPPHHLVIVDAFGNLEITKE
ncbi:hydantoinase/oxoprolinase family protein [Alicyclobacillus fastidiosus]|uniref:Hydantoinase/oxoprolinase family protein n=1 Tax=Alicyclobacillus fastidiosus TaxID=392011 RepID=A0ABY6ZA38_9BACL|nr:hydantoinase/oxoprolinase family protein [Alicyclobacillus fastidiosus]WAH39732.1 hydantoinase/oxoprolinase family protein [Alicyclobacillus fastidiosus]GMA60960.1 5-oxoprolinase [Alicyclobacillus fastidiosus]